MLQLITALATLANVNLRTEKLGKDNHRPAADLKFTVDVSNRVLDDLHPGLLHSLYKRPDEKGHQADLTAPDPDTLTTPRYPKAKPWASTEDWPGYFAEIKSGEFSPVAVELDKVTLKGIVAEAKNGGTVTLAFTISGYPSGEDVGALYDLMGHEVDLTISPPSIGDLDRLRAEAKAKPAPAPAPEPDDDDTDPPGDAQIGRAFPDAIDARGDAPPSARRAKATPAGVH